MDVNDWIREVRPEEIPIEYQDIVEAIGVEHLIKLSIIIGGTTNYFPKLDRLIQQTRDRLVIDEYNGYNVDELAHKYDISDVWVRRVIREHRLKADQMKLFNEVPG
jgi:Mor family transcriptional regulator